MSTLAKFKSSIEALITGALFLLVTGTPLLFTSLTRSVFEVNKLLLLRVVTIVVVQLWIVYHVLTRDNSPKEEAPAPKFWKIFPWKKIGLEIPMMGWVVLNILSTIFAQNFTIAIFGAYDRWEGILTVLNYALVWIIFAKWIQRPRQLQWLLGGILVSTTISASYGILQSFGIDFMNWSVNAAARVFACINNPVHFCAYVSMVVLIMMGWILSFPDSEKASKRQLYFKYFIAVCTILIYYAQFLSFSRATWLGFCLAATFFYLFALGLLNTKIKRNFIFEMFITTMVVAALYLLTIFKVYLNSVPIAIGLGVIVLIYVLFEIFSLENWHSKLKFIVPGILLAVLSWGVSPSQNSIVFLLQMASVAGFLYLSKTITDTGVRQLMTKIVILMAFATLQFVPSELSRMVIFYPSLGLSLFWLLKDTGDTNSAKEHKIWLTGFLIMFGLVISIPSFPGHISKLFNKNNNNETLSAVTNAQNRAKIYQESISGHSARYSMWKSALPWIRDYWFLGSGPDSVKYMYPDYRRVDYGILEGGHNFTPDKLHNEYINTLATRGVPASLVYYIALIGGWYVLTLRAFIRMKNNSRRYILLGLVSAATVYMGQILFNFGVVATLVLFYIFVGLGHAIAVHPELNGGSDEN